MSISYTIDAWYEWKTRNMVWRQTESFLLNSVDKTSFFTVLDNNDFEDRYDNHNITYIPYYYFEARYHQFVE